MKKYKSIILYNIGRLQEDFEYLFPNIKIKKYIVTDSKRYYKGIECIKLKYLKKTSRYLIVICDRKSDELTQKFINSNLVENKDFVYFEDFGKILDEKLTFKEKNIKYKYLDKYDIDFFDHDISNSEMLKKMIYADSFHNINCDNPFKYAQIENNGFVFLCCPGFVEQHLGNVFFKSPKKIWNSPRARLIRLSVINKTYAFCNLNLCKLCESKIDNDKKRISNLKVCKVPYQTVIGFDQTCNLKCKSCRNSSINHNNNKVYYDIYKRITKKLWKAGWLNKTNRLFLATQGEVFFSKTYQSILNSRKIVGLNSIVLHTNGILLTPKRLDYCIKHLKKNKVENIGINISVDSITDNIYESLRTGGNMKILKKNLEYLSKARREGKINFINMVVVLQKDNYKELPEIAKYAIDLNFDQLDIQKIMNFGSFTDEEFKEKNMFDEFGNMKTELAKVLRDPIFKSDKIKYVGNLDLFKNDNYIK